MDVVTTLHSVFVPAGEMPPAKVQEYAEIIKRFYSCNVHDMTVGTLVLFTTDARSWSEKKLIVDTFHNFVKNEVYLKDVKEAKNFLAPLEKWIDIWEFLDWAAFAKFFNEFFVEEQQTLDIDIEIDLPED